MAPVSSDFRDPGQTAGRPDGGPWKGLSSAGCDPSPCREGGLSTVHLPASGWILIHLVGKLIFSQLKALSGLSHMSFINKNESLLLHNCSSFARPNLSKPRGLGVVQGEKIKGNLDMNHLGTTCVGSTSGETLKRSRGLRRLSKTQALSGL